VSSLAGAVSPEFAEGRSSAEVFALAGSVRAPMDQITAVGMQKRAKEAAVVEEARQQVEAAAEAERLRAQAARIQGRSSTTRCLCSWRRFSASTPSGRRCSTT